MEATRDDSVRKPAAAQFELLEPGAPLPRLYQILLVLMLLFLGLLAVRQVGNPDTGFHLKAGDSILAGHGWPRTDEFTYTMNDHPYTDTTWGYQVLLALSYQVGGTAGMVVFHLAMLIAFFLLLYKTARLAPVDPATLVLLMGAGILACETRYEVRPEVLSYLFLAGTLYLLHRHAMGHKAPLWLLPLLFCVWANCHALFILGWMALACAFAGVWLRDRRPDKRLLLWTGAAFLAPLANPYGLKGLLFPFALLTRFQGQNVFAENVKEFLSPFAFRTFSAYAFYPHWPIWTFRLLALLAAPALVLLWKRRAYWVALVVLVFMPLEVKMIRNIPLLIVTALPAMIWVLPLSGLWRLLRMEERRARPARLAVLGLAGTLAVILGLQVWTGAYYVSSRRPTRFGLGWNRLMLPVAAADYVKKSGLPGPMLNHLNFGGYLMWALPQRVFIDGRLEVVGEEFYNRYQQIFSSEEGLERLVEEYNIRWIILPYAADPLLLTRLSGDSRWRLSYVDALAAAFVREGPSAQRWVDRASVDRKPPSAAEAGGLPGLGGPERTPPLRRWLAGLVAQPKYPEESYYLGMFHLLRNENADAEAWFRSALATGGEGYYEAYQDLGTAFLQQKKYDEAIACYDVVLQEDPQNLIALENLASLTRRGR